MQRYGSEGEYQDSCALGEAKAHDWRKTQLEERHEDRQLWGSALEKAGVERQRGGEVRGEVERVVAAGIQM